MSGVEDYVELLKAGQVERKPGVLPPHYPTCFGCGPQAQAGMHLEVRLEGDEVATDYAFTDLHSGAPGIAHGGPSPRSSTTCSATRSTWSASPG
jgi:hypothetical protein